MAKNSFLFQFFLFLFSFRLFLDQLDFEVVVEIADKHLVVFLRKIDEEIHHLWIRFVGLSIGEQKLVQNILSDGEFGELIKRIESFFPG